MAFRLDPKTGRYRDERGRFVKRSELSRRSLELSKRRLDRDDFDAKFESHVSKTGDLSYELTVSVAEDESVDALIDSLTERVKLRPVPNSWVQVGLVFEADDKFKPNYERLHGAAYAPTNFRGGQALVERFDTAKDIYHRLQEAGHPEPLEIVVRVKVASERPRRKVPKKKRPSRRH